MKHYATPKLEYIERQTQDVITASLVGDYNEEEGDVVSPGVDFWN